MRKSAGSRGTTLGMRRYWRKKKQLWRRNFELASSRIRQGKLKSEDIGYLERKRLISHSQARTLREKMKRT